jgi:hypothetical protein
MKKLSQHVDDENIKSANVSTDGTLFHVSLYYKEELLRVKTFVSEDEAENYAEDWVIINE